jgi:hypothetical protein
MIEEGTLQNGGLRARLAFLDPKVDLLDQLMYASTMLIDKYLVSQLLQALD